MWADRAPAVRGGRWARQRLVYRGGCRAGAKTTRHKDEREPRWQTGLRTWTVARVEGDGGRFFFCFFFPKVFFGIL